MTEALNPIVRDLSDLNKFNQCVDWDFGFRVFVKPDYSTTHPGHMGRLENKLNHVYWNSLGYKYSIRVWPKAYMSSKALHND